MIYNMSKFHNVPILVNIGGSRNSVAMKFAEIFASETWKMDQEWTKKGVFEFIEKFSH